MGSWTCATRNEAATKWFGANEETNLLLYGKIDFDAHAGQVDIIIWWKPRCYGQWLIESKGQCLSLDQIEGNAAGRHRRLRFCYEIH